MAENKKSFLLYADLISTVSKLTDQKAGKLFKTILEYVNDHNPEVEDILLQVAFEPIKLQLKRDLRKWEKYIDKQKENGKKGGRPAKGQDLEIPKNSDYGHFIYLIMDKETDEYKIGETSDLINRKRSIKRPTANLSVIDYAMLPKYLCESAEKEIIYQFKDKRISGDWFKLDENDVLIIRQLLSQKRVALFGNPKKADTVTVNVNDTVNDLPPSDEVFFDAEDLIIKNQIQFERICMAAKKMEPGAAKESLRKFHLYLVTNKKYPQTKNQILAGFEMWLMNENNRNGNQTHQSSDSKLGTSEARIAAAKKW